MLSTEWKILNVFSLQQTIKVHLKASHLNCGYDRGFQWARVRFYIPFGRWEKTGSRTWACCVSLSPPHSCSAPNSTTGLQPTGSEYKVEAAVLPQGCGGKGTRESKSHLDFSVWKSLICDLPEAMWQAGRAQEWRWMINPHNTLKPFS